MIRNAAIAIVVLLAAGIAVRRGVSSSLPYDNVLHIPRTAVFDVNGRPTV